MLGAANSLSQSPLHHNALTMPTYSEEADGHVTAAIEKEKKASAEARAALQYGEGYRRILDAVGQPGYPSMRALFHGQDGPPADTVPPMTVSFELFEAVQSRFVNTKLALERARVDLHTRHQQYAVLNSQHEQLQLEHNVLETRAADLEKKNTQLHQSIAKQDVTMEQLRQNIKHLKEEMLLMEDKVAKRDDELQITQNRVAAGLVSLSQKETIIANLRRQMGRGGRSSSSAQAHGTGVRDPEDDGYSAEILQRIADDVEGRSIEAQLRLFIVELEARIKSKEDEKKYVMLRHTMYRRHVRAIVEAYEQLCMTKEDAVASHVCEVSVSVSSPTPATAPGEIPMGGSRAFVSPIMPIALCSPALDDTSLVDSGLLPQEEGFTPRVLPTDVERDDVVRDNVVRDNVVRDNVVRDDVVRDNVVRDNVMREMSADSLRQDALNVVTRTASSSTRASSTRQKERLGGPAHRTSSSYQGSSAPTQSVSPTQDAMRMTPPGSTESTGRIKGQQQPKVQKSALRLDAHTSRGRAGRVSSSAARSKSNSPSEMTSQRQGSYSESESMQYPLGILPINDLAVQQSSSSGTSIASPAKRVSALTTSNSGIVIPSSNKRVSTLAAHDDDADRAQTNQSSHQSSLSTISKKRPMSPKVNSRVRELARNYSALHSAVERLQDFVCKDSREARAPALSFSDGSDAAHQAALIADAADADARLIDQLIRMLQRGIKMSTVQAAVPESSRGLGTPHASSMRRVASSNSAPNFRSSGLNERLPSPPKTLRPEAQEAMTGSMSGSRLEISVSSSVGQVATAPPSRQLARAPAPTSGPTAGAGSRAKEGPDARHGARPPATAGSFYPQKQGDGSPDAVSTLAPPSVPFTARVAHLDIVPHGEDDVADRLEKPAKEKSRGKDEKVPIGSSRDGAKGAAHAKPAGKRETLGKHLPAIPGPDAFSSNRSPQEHQQAAPGGKRKPSPSQQGQEDQRQSGIWESAVSRESHGSHKKTPIEGTSPRDLQPASYRSPPPHKEPHTVTADVEGAQQQSLKKEWAFSGGALRPVPEKLDDPYSFQLHEQPPSSAVENTVTRPGVVPTLPHITHPAGPRNTEPIRCRQRPERMPWHPTTVRIDQQSGVVPLSSDTSSIPSSFFHHAIGSAGIHGSGGTPRAQVPGQPTTTDIFHFIQQHRRAVRMQQQHSARTGITLALGGSSMLPTRSAHRPGVPPLAPSPRKQRVTHQYGERSHAIPSPPNAWMYPSQGAMGVDDTSTQQYNNNMIGASGLSVTGFSTMNYPGHSCAPMPQLTRYASAPRVIPGHRLSLEQLTTRILRQSPVLRQSSLSLHNQKQEQQSGLGQGRSPRQFSPLAQAQMSNYWKGVFDWVGPAKCSTEELIYRLYRRNHGRRNRQHWAAPRPRPRSFSAVEQDAQLRVQCGRLRTVDILARKARRMGWARRTPPAFMLRRRLFKPKPKRGDHIPFQYSPLVISSLGGNSSPVSNCSWREDY